MAAVAPFPMPSQPGLEPSQGAMYLSVLLVAARQLKTRSEWETAFELRLRHGRAAEPKVTAALLVETAALLAAMQGKALSMCESSHLHT
jgi:hypothetical protein